MELIVATGNAHKLLELAPALPGHRLLAPKDIGFARFEVDEDGEDYVDNALKKARTLHRLCGRPALADDSGLSVRALGGEPGVRSARYGSEEGGPPLDSEERNFLLLRRMEGQADRDCAFVCCLVLVLSPDRFYVIQETCPGRLLEAPRGSGGFGYDPIVFLPGIGKSVAELSLAEKNRLSHRGRACARMAALLGDLEARP